MGMFDWIRFEDACPNCDAKLECFQSKDGYCVSESVKPHKVNTFYTSCHSCNAWIEYYKGHREKKWTRTVYEKRYSETEERILYEHTKQFSKKYLKKHTTKKDK